MSRARPALPAFFGLIFIAGCLIAAVLLLTAFNSYPRQAEELFGPPAPSLSALQRYRLSYALVQEQDSLLTPRDPAGPEIRFIIPPGEPVGIILDRLEVVGLVADQGTLRDYLVYTGLDTQLQTGEFVLTPGMTAVEVIGALIDPTPRFATVAVLPGWRLEELALSLPTTGLSFSGEAFIAAAHTRPDGFSILQDLPAGVSLEGFFLPGSYELPRDAAPDDLLRALLQAFEDQVGPDLRAGFGNQGLTLYQAVILALSDPTAAIAAPLTVLAHHSRPQDAAAIAQIAAEHQAARIIVGQTFDLDGKPDLSGRAAARLAAAIRTQTDLPVELWDESHSTQQARASRIEIGVKRGKRVGHLDDHAAAVILQSYLDAHREELKS